MSKPNSSEAVQAPQNPPPTEHLRPANDDGQDTLRAALAYDRKYGFSIVPQLRGELRKAACKFKNLPRLTDQDLIGWFDRGDFNVAAKAGSDSGGLVDIDLDCREAVQFAGAFLPATGWHWGRLSNPDSHWLYRLTDGDLGKSIVDPIRDEMIVELRGQRNKLITLPPGLHASGETIDFSGNVKAGIAETSGAELLRQCRLLAAAVLFARYAPTDLAHDYLMAMGGACFAQGLAVEVAEPIAMAVIAGFETSRAADHLQTFKDAWKTKAPGEHLLGWGALEAVWTCPDDGKPKLKKHLKELLGSKAVDPSALPRVVKTIDGLYYLTGAGSEEFRIHCKSSSLQVCLNANFPGAFAAHCKDFNLKEVDGHASYAGKYSYSYVDSTTVYDEPMQTLRVGCPIDPTLTPTFDSDVDDWLAAVGGPDKLKLEQWIAGCRPDRLTCPSPALCLFGPAGTGKTVMAFAVSRIWGTEPVPGRVIASKFNGDMLRTPIVLCDEQLPPKLSGEAFREQVTCAKQSIERKGCERVTCKGHVRLVLAANDPTALTLEGDKSADDVRAIADRICVVTIPESRESRIQQAADAIREPSDPSRLDLRRIAEHFLSLWDTVRLPKTKRFVLPPDGLSVEFLHQAERDKGEGMWELVQRQVDARDTNRYAAIIVRGDRLYVHPSELADELKEKDRTVRGWLKPFVVDKRAKVKIDGKTVSMWQIDNEKARISLGNTDSDAQDVG